MAPQAGAYYSYNFLVLQLIGTSFFGDITNRIEKTATIRNKTFEPPRVWIPPSLSLASVWRWIPHTWKAALS